MSASHCYFKTGDSVSNINNFDFMRVLIGGHNMFEARAYNRPLFSST
jgi:hypothetical protein